jgi:hypothetical protein
MWYGRNNLSHLVEIGLTKSGGPYLPPGSNSPATVVAFIACRLPSMLTYLHFIPFHAACDIAVSKAFPFCLQHLFCACNIYVYVVPTHHHSKGDEKKQKSSSIFYSKVQSIQIQIDQGIPGWPWVPELPGHSVSVLYGTKPPNCSW